MDKKFRNYEIAGYLITSALAVIFHYLYEWLPNPIIAAISPVNESIWEHIKIIFFPYLLWAILEYILYRPEDSHAFCSAKCYSLAAMPVMLLIFNYTYSGIIGYNITAIDIGSTFVYLLAAFIISYNGYKKRWNKLSWAATLLSIVFCLSLVLFTFIPPHIELFKDPITGIYGMG